MLKVSNTEPKPLNLDKHSPLLRDFMVLEEGETLNSDSVRNPKKRQEALDLLEHIKVVYEKKCTPYIPDPNGKSWQVVPRKNGTYKHVYVETGTPAVLTAQFNSLVNQLFELLIEYFLPTRPTGDADMMQEIRCRLTEGKDSIDVNTCYNSTFCVHIMTVALNEYSLPMMMARLWKAFSQNYTNLVMSSLKYK